MSAGHLRQVTGFLASCHFAVHVSSPSSVNPPDGPLQREGQSADQADPPVVASGQSSLVFWSQRELVYQGVPLRPPAPSHVLTTDASNYGWGAVCGPLLARSIWSRDHVALHINHLELETVFLTLKTFQRWMCRTHVLVQTDSATVMHWGMGGPGPGAWTNWSRRSFYGMMADFEHFSNCSPYFRLQQCRGGLSLSPQSGAPSLLGALHRMVS